MSAASAPETLKSRVESALAQHVGPALEMDGTLLEVLDVTDGVARIRLGGVCGKEKSACMDVPGITLYLQPVQDLTVETRVSRTQYQYSLESPDAKELAEWSDKLLDRMQTIPELRDVASDQQDDGLQVLVKVNRDTATRLGVSMQMIGDALFLARCRLMKDGHPEVLRRIYLVL